VASTVTRLMRDELPAAQLSGPKTRFDEPVGHNRVFEGQSFDLDDFKAMKSAAGVTINDIAVAVVAGTIRKYLSAHNELPEDALLCSMPVNMRTRVGENQDNNQVGAMSGSLHTNIADPVERLKAIKLSLDQAKAFIDTPLVSVMKIPGTLPPAIAKPIWRAYVRNKLTRRMPMGQVTVITNVPGPPFPLYCAGAKLVQFYPLGLINPGMGLFHAVFSYGGKVFFGVLADRDQMPDPEFYRQCLDAAYAELREALLGARAAARPASRPARRAKPSAVPARRKPAAKPKRASKPAVATRATRKR
jgi:WS/DGAT/MGAT family acyltransferase